MLILQCQPAYTRRTHNLLLCLFALTSVYLNLILLKDVIEITKVQQLPSNVRNEGRNDEDYSQFYDKRVIYIV